MGSFHLFCVFSILKCLAFFFFTYCSTSYFKVPLFSDPTAYAYFYVIFCMRSDLAGCLGAYAQLYVWCEAKNLWKSWKIPSQLNSSHKRACCIETRGQGGPAAAVDIQKYPFLLTILLAPTLTVTIGWLRPALSPCLLTWGHASVCQKKCTKPGLPADIKPGIFAFVLLTKLVGIWVLLPNRTTVTFETKRCWSLYCKVTVWQPGFFLSCWSRQIQPFPLLQDPDQHHGVHGTALPTPRVSLT